jgi:hypothetical protein
LGSGPDGSPTEERCGHAIDARQILPGGASALRPSWGRRLGQLSRKTASGVKDNPSPPGRPTVPVSEHDRWSGAKRVRLPARQPHGLAPALCLRAVRAGSLGTRSLRSATPKSAGGSTTPGLQSATRSQPPGVGRAVRRGLRFVRQLRGTEEPLQSVHASRVVAGREQPASLK